MFKTITYKGNEYIITHEFSNDHIWGFRNIKHDIIELYRQCKGAITTETVLVPILQQVFAAREQLGRNDAV